MRMHRLRVLTGTVLNPLRLSPATIPEHSAAGTVVGALSNLTAGSTLSLTVDAGTRFAISGTNIVAGATATDYVTATSHNITVRETEAGALNTPNDTVITIAVTNVTGGLSTPTLSLFSAAGASPLILQGSDADYVAGYRGQLQIATDSGFTTITQNRLFFIDGASWASNSVSTGVTTPAGTYFARWRICRDNEVGTLVTGTDVLGDTVSFNADVSLWSNTVTDTISGSVAVLNTVTGTNKNSLITVSGTPTLTYAGVSGGAKQAVRTTIEQASGKAQFEITINSGATGDIVVGLEDGTTNLNTNTLPGFSNNVGIAVEFNIGAYVTVNWNTGVNQTTLVNNVAGTIANGDIFTVVMDTTNHTIDVYRTRSGTTTQMGSQATGLPTLSHYYGFCGVNNTTSSGTMNYGATSYAKTPGSGVAAIWA